MHYSLDLELHYICVYMENDKYIYNRAPTPPFLQISDPTGFQWCIAYQEVEFRQANFPPS